MITTATGMLPLDGGHIEFAAWSEPARASASATTVVLLHEGLGSVALWRDFPERLADAVATRVVAYSRFGYGRSSSIERPRPLDYLEHEARRHLPRVLAALDATRHVLLGHSDGASIALMYAAERPPGLEGLVLLAPHVKVEDVTVRGLLAARHAYEHGELRAKLARWHDDVDAAFLGWNDAWLDPEFRSWNIERRVPRVEVPIVAVQGRDDEYGTLDQIQSIAELNPRTELVALDCGHALHRERPEDVIAATLRCLARAPRIRADQRQR